MTVAQDIESNQSRILIGVPAFRGKQFIGETLHSIKQQDHRDFRVIISVDNNDTDTAAACNSFLDDPRFTLVMQDHQLGWDGNINWLMSQPDYDFFCFWQQDDLTSSDYLSALLRGARANPAAVCYFSDIQWIGSQSNLATSPSITGFAIWRALSVLESLNGIPFRGLIRKDAIERAGPIRRTPFESAFEEFIWVARLAREGDLCRVIGPTYFKRAHSGSTHQKWHEKDAAWKRNVWLEVGIGMLETLWPVLRESERTTALAFVIDRLCNAANGRFLFFDPISEKPLFMSDFLTMALERFSIPVVEAAISRSKWQATFCGSLYGDVLDRAIQWTRHRRDDTLNSSREFSFSLGQLGTDLLESGWSQPEAWGTWNGGPVAQLRLPVWLGSGRWKIKIKFVTYGLSDRPIVVRVRLDSDSEPIEWRMRSNQILQREVIFGDKEKDPCLHFSFPDALSPYQLGFGQDKRNLSLGLISLSLIALN